MITQAPHETGQTGSARIPDSVSSLGSDRHKVLTDNFTYRHIAFCGFRSTRMKQKRNGTGSSQIRFRFDSQVRSEMFYLTKHCVSFNPITTVRSASPPFSAAFESQKTARSQSKVRMGSGTSPAYCMPAHLWASR